MDVWIIAVVALGISTVGVLNLRCAIVSLCQKEPVLIPLRNLYPRRKELETICEQLFRAVGFHAEVYFDPNFFFIQGYAERKRNKPIIVLTSVLIDRFSNEEIRGVIAHELGHHAKKHTGNWMRLLSCFEIWAAPLFTIFRLFRKQRITEVFERRLARELEADSFAAKIVGKQCMAQSLARIRSEREIMRDLSEESRVSLRRRIAVLEIT